MLAACRTRQQQANSIDQAPAAWEPATLARHGNVNSTVFSIPATERQKNRRDALN